MKLKFAELFNYLIITKFFRRTKKYSTSNRLTCCGELLDNEESLWLKSGRVLVGSIRHWMGRWT